MLKKSLLVVGTLALLNGSSTMCFKKNHQDPSTIETVALDGGKCAGIKNVSDMKKDGFVVEDIKIKIAADGLDYIYIFKTAQPLSSKNIETINNNEAMTKDQIKEYMQQLNVQNKEKSKKKKKQDSLKLGKTLYTSICYKCHGIKADISAYNTARPLNTLSIEQIQISFRDYANNDKDNGMAILMRPYASKLNANDILNVATYIQTLK